MKSIEKMRLAEAEEIIGELENDSPLSVDKLESLKKIIRLLAQDSETYRIGFVEQLALVAKAQEKEVELLDTVNNLLKQKEELFKTIDELRGMK